MITSITIKFRKSKVKHRQGSCFIQLIHKRKMTTLTTGVRLDEKEWDCSKVCVSFRKATPKRAKELLAMQEHLEKMVASLESIVAEKEQEQVDFTVEMLVEEYKGLGLTKSFFSMMEHRILLLEEAGQKRTASNYRGTLRMFKAFRNGQDIPSDHITALLMEEYEMYLKKRGNGLNTISYYMRILKAAYNYGLKKRWIKENKYPFLNVFTGIEKTAKRAVDEEVVQKLEHLDLRNKPMLELAKDIFFFSVYTRGMSFIDIAYLKKEYLSGNVLVYKRHKTNQKIEVTLPDCAMQIIKKYVLVMTESDYVFPLLYSPGRKKMTVYSTALHNHNDRLKQISKLLGLSACLTSYTSRHTWASLAKKNGVETYIISEAMGHTSENTTRIYLASLNNTVLDKANEIVIKSIQMVTNYTNRKL
jgi:integrase